MKESRFPLGHYYSPVPNTDKLEPSKWEGIFQGIVDLDIENQLTLLTTLTSKSQELSNLPGKSDNGFHWDNPMFPPGDALIYYGLARHLKPETIIEIGSGYSSLIVQKALEKNQSGHLSCVEPYPPDFLKMQKHISIIENNIQTVDLGLFDSLNSGDILFVDSSHQCKTQSDVNFIFFNILPSLNAGVYIHFHDIFLPDEYPLFWLTEGGTFFNEQYLLLAFLQCNREYEVIFSNSYMFTRYQKKIANAFEPIYSQHQKSFWRNIEGTPNVIKGGSFWIRKNNSLT